jgi:hypothetical protein
LVVVRLAAGIEWSGLGAAGFGGTFSAVFFRYSGCFWFKP